MLCFEQKLGTGSTNCPDITEKNVDWEVKHQHKQNSDWKLCKTFFLLLKTSLFDKAQM